MLDSIDKSLRAIVGTIEVIQKTAAGVWNFILDPLTAIRAIADPVVLVTLAVMILLKAFGLDTGKWIKITVLVYLILLLL